MPAISRKKRPLPTTPIMPRKHLAQGAARFGLGVARRFLVDEQGDHAHQHDPAGRAVEHVLPVPAAHDAGHDRAPGTRRC